MAITHIHTFLVPPKSQEGAGEIGGAAVPLEGKLFDLLMGIYEKSDNQSHIDISFDQGPGGAQQNDARALILAYLADATVERGRHIAMRLQSVTDGRSKLGLLFLIKGQEGADHKIVLSRFPADNGILADMDPAGLTVAFLEKVFMKNSHSYKAAAYQGPSLLAGFWQGQAVDRQVGDPVARLSDYWIKGFLASDFRTTAARGTRSLASALKFATTTVADVKSKRAATAAATLAGGLDGQAMSITDFQQRFNLPADVRKAMNQALKTPQTANEQFIFNADEFARQVAFRSVELDSGVILTAQNGDFDSVFEQEDLGDGNVRFTTTGHVVGERLRSKVG